MSPEERIKERILSRYKSVRAFTQDVGISYSTVDSMLKRGVSGAGIGTVLKVCHALDLDVEDLLDEQKEKSPPPEKPVDEETRNEVTNIVMDMVTKLGWIEENGDISDAHRKMLEIILLTIQLGSADPTKQ